MFTRIPIPGLANIPVLGPIFFNTNLFVYLMFIFLDRDPGRTLLHPLGIALALGG